MPYCLDTTFLVDFLRGDPAAVERARRLEESMERKYVAAPAAYELLEGALIRGERHLSKSLLLLDSMEVVPTDLGIASEAARLSSQGRKTGHPMASIDALIAATATVKGWVLLTRDRAFFGVDGLAAEKY